MKKTELQTVLFDGHYQGRVLRVSADSHNWVLQVGTDRFYYGKLENLLRDLPQTLLRRSLKSLQDLPQEVRRLACFSSQLVKELEALVANRRTKKKSRRRQSKKYAKKNP